MIDSVLGDVKLIEPRSFADERGWFAEVFNEQTFASHGLPHRFVQDNQSFSRKGVLRGLHYQVDEPQGKLVRVLSGHIWDVAVDLRPGSQNYGKHVGFHLTSPTETNPLQLLWIPEGFAHGFLVLSDSAEVLYKTTRFYQPAKERCVRWDDPTLKIPWPLDQLEGAGPSVSEKDAAGSSFLAAEI